ncbi:MAG: HobA family DNA replication regulator [Helicobacter sp.]|nr:HobA family DNA replication regulator [Helicobacter sp.]
MLELNEWLLEFSRSQNNHIALNAGWLEVERYSLSPLLSSTINFILNGGTMLLCSDYRFDWFVHFVTSNINSKDRPLVPIIPLKSILPDTQRLSEYSIVQDMLSVSFKEYRFWYIGSPNNDIAKLALSKEKGFLWVLDEEIRDAFIINSRDKLLHYKLIQLYKIFEATLFGAMFGEISLD